MNSDEKVKSTVTDVISETINDTFSPLEGLSDGALLFIKYYIQKEYQIEDPSDIEVKVYPYNDSNKKIIIDTKKEIKNTKKTEEMFRKLADFLNSPGFTIMFGE